MRHVDVSIAGIDTIWRWRGWASTDEHDPLRNHRALDVYRDGEHEPHRLAPFHRPLPHGLQLSLGKVEWAVAETIAGAQEGWRPTLGALRSARRGTFKPRQLPAARPRSSSERSSRPAQPVRLNGMYIDVTNVWERATARLVITRSKIDIQLRGSDSLGAGDLPAKIQKALRYGAEATRQSATLQLAAAARVLAGRVPSYELACQVEEDYEQQYGPLVHLGA